MSATSNSLRQSGEVRRKFVVSAFAAGFFVCSWFKVSADKVAFRDAAIPGLVHIYVAPTGAVRAWEPPAISGVDWTALVLDIVMLGLFCYLFGSLFNVRWIRIAMLAAFLVGLLQDFSLIAVAGGPTGDQRATWPFILALLRFGLFGAVWIALGQILISRPDAAARGRNRLLLGVVCFVLLFGCSFIGGSFWHWAAFLFPAAYAALAVVDVLRFWNLNTGLQAFTAAGGVAYVMAGVITLFAVMFAPSHIERADVPLLAALSLQVAILWTTWIEAAHQDARLQSDAQGPAGREMQAPTDLD